MNSDVWMVLMVLAVVTGIVLETVRAGRRQ